MATTNKCVTAHNLIPDFNSLIVIQIRFPENWIRTYYSSIWSVLTVFYKLGQSWKHSFFCILMWMQEHVVQCGQGMCALNRFSFTFPRVKLQQRLAWKRSNSPSLYIFFKLSKLGPLGSINPAQRPGAECLFLPSLPLWSVDLPQE